LQPHHQIGKYGQAGALQVHDFLLALDGKQLPGFHLVANRLDLGLQVGKRGIRIVQGSVEPDLGATLRTRRRQRGVDLGRACALLLQLQAQLVLRDF